MRDDVYVYLRDDLPPHIHEMVAPNADGTYTIIIDSTLSYASQCEAYNHALEHIERGHFDVDCTLSVQEIEAQAHHRSIKGEDFIQITKKKQRKESRKVSFLKEHGHDFFRSAENRYLEPEI